MKTVLRLNLGQGSNEVLTLLGVCLLFYFSRRHSASARGSEMREVNVGVEVVSGPVSSVSGTAHRPAQVSIEFKRWCPEGAEEPHTPRCSSRCP